MKFVLSSMLILSFYMQFFHPELGKHSAVISLVTSVVWLWA